MVILLGYVIIYVDIVCKIDSFGVVCVVGIVVGCNLISWLILCYCVICKDGVMGGYYWGLLVKWVMLVYEII